MESLLRQLDWLRVHLAKTYKEFKGLDPHLDATLMALLQSMRRNHPLLKAYYEDRALPRIAPFSLTKYSQHKRPAGPAGAGACRAEKGTE